MYMMWKINSITMHNSIYKIESNIFCLFSYIILTNSMNWFAYLGKENRCTWCGKKILHYNAIYIYFDKIPQWIKKYCITMQCIYILTKYLNELKNTALQCNVYIFWQNTSMNWFASLIFCAQDPAMSPYFGYTLGCPSTEEADQLQRYTITRGSVGWACVAHLSFCFEEA
jgi:hypothetical protein